MVLKCDIVFDNYQDKTFYSGDLVKGNVIIECDSKKKINDVIFRVKGETTCEWSVSDNDNSTTYSAKELHFRNVTSLLTNAYPKNDGYATFAEGIHEFQFSFQLPDNLPTNYEGWYGKVKYGIKIIIDRPMKLNIINRWPFNVTTRFDTKSNVLFKTPINHTISENFHTLFMQQGKLTIDVRIPASAYCKGQEIPLECMVKNQSKISLSGIRLWLERKMTFTSTTPSTTKRSLKEKIANFKGDGVDKEKNKFFSVKMVIPDAVPTYTTSQIYSVEYAIKIEVIASGMHSNLKTKIPVTIGCLPPFIPPITRRVSHSGDPSKVTFELCRRSSTTIPRDDFEKRETLKEEK